MKVFAKVQVTIEVSSDQPWSEETSVKQINKTAIKEAIEMVNRHFTTERIGIVGLPVVTVVSIKE